MDLRGSGTAVPLSGTPAPACNIHLRVTPHKGKRVFREMSYQNLLSQTISIGLAPLGKPELAATFLPSLRVKSWAGLVLISIDEAAKAAQQITSRTKVWLMNCSDAVVSIDREQALPGDSIQLRRGDKVHIHAWTFLVDWDFVYGDSSDVQAGLPAAVAHTSPVGQQNPALVLRNQQLQQQQQHQHQQAQQQQYHVQQPLSQPLPQQLVQQAHQQPPGVFQQTQHGQQHLHLQQAADPYGQQQMHRGYPGQQNPFPQTVVPTQPSQELMAHMAQQRQLIEEQSRRYEEQRKQLEELVAKQQQTIEKLNTVATGPVVPAPSPDTTSVSADDLVMDDQEREEAKPKKTQKKGGRPKKLKGQRGRRSSEEDLSSLEEPPSEPDNEPEEVEEKQEPPKRTRRASRSAKASSTIKTRRKSKGKKRSSPREGAATPTSSRSGRTISPPGTSTVDLVDRQKQAYREVRRLAKIAEGETVSQSFSLVPSRRAGTKRKRSDVEVDSVEEQRKILDETRSASARAYRESLKTGLQLRRKRRKVADNDTPALAEKKPKAEDEDSKEEPLVEEESRRASEESEGKEEEGSKSGEGDLDPSNLPLSPNPLPSPSLPPVSPITSPMPPGEGSASLSHQDDSGDIEMASPPSHVSSNSGTASTAFGLEQASAAAGLKPAADIDMPNAAALEAESLSNCTDTVDLTSSPEQAGTSLPSPDLQEQAHREMVLTAPLTPLAHSYTRVPLGPVQPSQPETRPQAAGCETAPAASPWPAPQAGAFSEANAANCMDELCGELDRTSDVSMSSTLGVYTDGTPA